MGWLLTGLADSWVSMKPLITCLLMHFQQKNVKSFTHKHQMLDGPFTVFIYMSQKYHVAILC